MISLRTAYYYIFAVKINLIKIFKKIYFKTGFYKKSLISKAGGLKDQVDINDITFNSTDELKEIMLEIDRGI